MNSLDIGSDVDWAGPEGGGHGLVHDAVVLHEPQAALRQRRRVLQTNLRPINLLFEKEERKLYRAAGSCNKPIDIINDDDL